MNSHLPVVGNWLKSQWLGQAIVGVSMGALMVTNANAEIGFGANIEIDTDFISNSDTTGEDDFDLGGRVKFSITGDHNINDSTVLSGVGQLIIGVDGDTGVDDAFIRLGGDTWGVRFGRYEALDLFSKGTDTFVLTYSGVPNYQANAARGRFDEAGHIGLELTPSDRFTLHLDGVWGESDSDDVLDEDALAGFRPAIVVDLTDDLRLTTGLDYLKDGDLETKGGAIYLRYATDAFALKLNYAAGEQELADLSEIDTTSYNANIEFGNIGFGLQRSENDDSGASADTFYARYLFRDLMGNENANAQLAFSAISIDPAEGEVLEEDTSYGVRLRFFYEF